MAKALLSSSLKSEPMMSAVVYGRLGSLIPSLTDLRRNTGSSETFVTDFFFSVTVFILRKWHPQERAENVQSLDVTHSPIPTKTKSQSK